MYNTRLASQHLKSMGNGLQDRPLLEKYFLNNEPIKGEIRKSILKNFLNEMAFNSLHLSDYEILEKFYFANRDIYYTMEYKPYDLPISEAEALKIISEYKKALKNNSSLVPTKIDKTFIVTNIPSKLEDANSVGQKNNKALLAILFALAAYMMGG